MLGESQATHSNLARLRKAQTAFTLQLRLERRKIDVAVAHVNHPKL